jgi:hypothetical protein
LLLLFESSDGNGEDSGQTAKMVFELNGIRIEQTQHAKIRDKKMAKLQISVHIDLRQDAQPLVDALQHVADSIEGYYGYKMGCSGKMDANYNAMIWGANHLAGLISKERPSYEFGYSDEHDAKLKKLFDGVPFPPDTPYS